MKKETVTPSIQPDKILLTGIILLKCTINSTDEYLENAAKPARIVMELGTSPLFNLDDRKCRFRLHIKLAGQDNTDAILGINAEFLLDFIFEIENMNDFIVHHKEDILVHPLLGSTLLGICFSTARGIVLERTKGTPLAGFILPVINPSKVLFASSDKLGLTATPTKQAAARKRKSSTPAP